MQRTLYILNYFLLSAREGTIAGFFGEAETLRRRGDLVFQ